MVSNKMAKGYQRKERDYAYYSPHLIGYTSWPIHLVNYNTTMMEEWYWVYEPIIA